ncbi:hypothetical protein [Actinospica robiniae]|uniref:hypothetical protein n=1 Tax=Actinospica robiniae TaxID=304901 RepID=UPI000413B3E0|nr:hypothetical protein [Actinospica robiniae]
MSIGIAYTDSRRFQDRSSVTTVVYGTDDPDYDAVALLPADDWTALPSQIASRLHAFPGAEASTVVELVRVPEMPLLDAVHRFEPLGDRHPAQFLGYTECAANQRTTTTDHRTRRRLGIHLDNFDRMPLDRRHQSRRRIGINLGPGPRYLLLTTQDIKDIARLSPLIEREPHTHQVRSYVAGGGRLACVRFRLEPGEGYIAPTELIPHDGSTCGVDSPSTIAFWLGEWPRGALLPAV